MDQVLFTWISVVVIFVIGSLAHFLYDFSHNNKILGIFAAVNESTWEHIKIAITPTLLWSLVDGYIYGMSPNYFMAKIVSLLILVFFIPFVFYSYTRLSHKPILFIDICTFLIAIILAQFSFYYLVNLPAIPKWSTYISTVGTFFFFGAYMTLTLMPLKRQIFKDPITGKYGFLAHSNFFKKKKSKK